MTVTPAASLASTTLLARYFDLATASPSAFIKQRPAERSTRRQFVSPRRSLAPPLQFRYFPFHAPLPSLRRKLRVTRMSAACLGVAHRACLN
eukprot:1195335-Prorocentrum_minimum.AAC.10